MTFSGAPTTASADGLDASPPRSLLVPDGLVHADDTAPGLRRRKAGRGFVYLDDRPRGGGRRITDADTLARIRTLAIPPAWTDVWICPDPLGHIQASGRDAKGRKQYRYHERWTSERNAAKFDSLAEFGLALPALRARVEEDMRSTALSFERVVATTVWLLDRTLIRIGNREYSDSSFGLTTLLDEHADAATRSLRLRFVGKSGREHDVTVRDPRVARTVRRCQDLPGQRLLQYVDGDTIRPVESRDVNDYIRDVTASDFTAKTFRTWGASSYATSLLAACGPCGDRCPEGDLRDTVKETASLLRNTPAVCRSSYIHPVVFDAHRDGWLHDVRPGRRAAKVMAAHERHLLALLEYRPRRRRRAAAQTAAA